MSHPRHPALKRRARFRLPLRGKLNPHYFFITTNNFAQRRKPLAGFAILCAFA